MIYLLDLNYTLVGNSEEKRSPFIKQINYEQYRTELVEKLRGERVFLLTARPDAYREETLQSILLKTGWQPERAYFNTYGAPPPMAKEAMLLRIRQEFTNETFFGIESNPKTRAMYAKHGVPAEPWERWICGHPA